MLFYNNSNNCMWLVAYCLIIWFIIFTHAKSAQPQTDNNNNISIDNPVIERLRHSLKLKTVCWAVDNFNKSALELVVSFIEKSYPKLHNSPNVEWQKVSNYSLLYKIHGQNPDLKPYLVTAHYDVVPTDGQVWTHPPFEAEVVDGIIYGRGAVDNKGNVFAILEAMEDLLQHGFKPMRTIFLAFGHDEECGGKNGAEEVVKILERDKVKLAFIHDEGTAIADGLIPNLNRLVAAVSISEKGFATVELTVKTAGGHASMPGKESSIGVLSNAIARLEANPQESRLSHGSTESLMFEELSNYLSFPYNYLLKYNKLFAPILSFFLSYNPTLNSLIRTTTAVTMFHAGTKENVIAMEAKAVIDHRIHLTQTLEEVIEHDIRVINDERVQLKVLKWGKPTPQSCYKSSPPSSSSSSSSSSPSYCPGFEVIKKSILETWDEDEIIIVPASLFAMTDSRHYVNITDNIYRFIPIRFQLREMTMVHGVDERISIKAYIKWIDYYRKLFVNADNSKGYEDGNNEERDGQNLFPHQDL